MKMHLLSFCISLPCPECFAYPLQVRFVATWAHDCAGTHKRAWPVLGNDACPQHLARGLYSGQMWSYIEYGVYSRVYAWELCCLWHYLLLPGTRLRGLRVRH